jgi:5-methylcytosine-specific restriction endonuclease McrA
MNYKICTKCGKEFPATDEFFYGDKRGEYRGRLRAACKICQRPSKEKKVVHSATYRKNNKEKIRISGAKYYQNNKEKEAIRGAKYRKNNKEKIRVSDAEYYQNNKERVAIYGAKYRKANPDKIAAKYARREVHKLNQTPVLTEAENQQVIDIYKKRKELGSNWHVDHAVPLSKGGLHHPDNLQIVLKKYNLQKGSKLNFRLPTDTEIYKFRPVQDNT